MEATVSSFRYAIGVPESENINAVLFGGKDWYLQYRLF